MSDTDQTAIPPLDELAPSPNRKGRRGRLTKEDQALLARRAAVQAILDRLAAAEEKSKQDEDARNALQRKLQRADADKIYLNVQLDELRDKHDNETLNRVKDVEDLTRFLLTATQLTRLSGIEFQNFIATIGDSVTVTFQFGDYKATVVPGKLTLQTRDLPGRRKKMKDFLLDPNGALPITDALAILGFLGIQRDPEDAYPTAMCDALFGTEGSNAYHRAIGDYFAPRQAGVLIITDPKIPGSLPQHNSPPPNPLGSIFK